MIELRAPTVFHGPNPLANEPVLAAELLVPAEQADSLWRATALLASRCANWFPGAASDPNGSPQQRIGTFLAEWAWHALVFVRGYLEARGCAPDPDEGTLLVWVGFHEPRLSMAVLDLGARWLNALARQPTAGDSFGAELDQLWHACRQCHPDYQAAIVMQAARRRDIPWAPAWGLARHWRFGHGARSRVLLESSSCADSFFGARIAASKALTKSALQALGLPTPAFRLVANDVELDAAAAAVGYPCATKPLDRGGGKGVTAGLHDSAALRQGFMTARAESAGPVMVEAHVGGEDHRLMVVHGRLVAAIRRQPPSVTGDGRHTIGELVAAKNVGRDARGLARSGFRRPIVLDASARLHLAGLGLSVDTVLEAGRTLRVRSNANLSTGGDCIDVTAQVNLQVRALAETLARTLELRMLGADYLTTHIGHSPEASGGSFIEINITPALDVLVAAGWSIEDAGELALLAEGEAPGRIPVELVVVPQASIAESRAVLKACTWLPDSGWACGGSASLGGVPLAVAANTPWAGVQCLIGHRGLGRALVLAGSTDVRRDGLPLDAFDTAHVLDDLPAAWLQVLHQACHTVNWHGHAGDVSMVLKSLAA